MIFGIYGRESGEGMGSSLDKAYLYVPRGRAPWDDSHMSTQAFSKILKGQFYALYQYLGRILVVSYVVAVGEGQPRNLASR